MIVSTKRRKAPNEAQLSPAKRRCWWVSLPRLWTARMFAKPSSIPRGGGGAGFAASERLCADARAEDQRREQGERQEAERGPGDARAGGHRVPHHPDGHQQPEHGGHRRDQQPVADVRDRRGVVHQTVDGVSDALVVERAHRQSLDPLEHARAIEVVERLREPQREAELEEAQQASGEAVAVVRFVLGGGCGVASGREIAFGAVDLGGRRAERADRQHQQRLGAEQPEQDLERVPARQRGEQRPHEGGVARERIRDRIPVDDMVDDQLHGPGQQQARRQAGEGQPELSGESPAQRRHVAKRAAEAAGASRVHPGDGR